jgi:hypothetical protein
MRDHRPAHAELSASRKLKHNARSYARVYLSRGKLVAVPCSCGCRTPLRALQMHHEDYNKPLDVVFCCADEHARLDAARFARLRAEVPEMTSATA